ncbi:MAG: M23 family metallopeptidase [Elusimicrobia bacterium]|nr:M23 family metallopeptidase [Elusimicrobiota bacterium]
MRFPKTRRSLEIFTSFVAAALLIAGIRLNFPKRHSAIAITYPDIIEPGQTLRILARGLSPGAEPGLSFLGAAHPFYRTGGGDYRALIGVPVDCKSGDYEWTLLDAAVRRATGASGSPQLPTPPWGSRVPGLSPWGSAGGRGPGSRFAVYVRPSRYPSAELSMPKGKMALTQDPRIQEAAALIRSKLTLETADQLWKGKFGAPLRGRLTEIYGTRRRVNRNAAWRIHRGQDIAAKAGSPVQAPNAGEIVLTGAFPLQGKLVILNHGQGVSSLYMHLESIAVREGQRVEAGELIGAAGTTGFSSAPHLHWGLYLHGEAVDPQTWLEFEF